MSFVCHIHNYTEYNLQWNVFSAFNPSKCTHTWSSGQPTLQRPGSSRGFGALLKSLTSVVDNFSWSWDSNPHPRATSPTLYPLEPRLPLPQNCIWHGTSFKNEKVKSSTSKIVSRPCIYFHSAAFILAFLCEWPLWLQQHRSLKVLYSKSLELKGIIHRYFPLHVVSKHAFLFSTVQWMSLMLFYSALTFIVWTATTETFFKTSSSVLHRRKSVIQV